jgi:hypothetical protein
VGVVLVAAQEGVVLTDVQHWHRVVVREPVLKKAFLKGLKKSAPGYKVILKSPVLLKKPIL